MRAIVKPFRRPPTIHIRDPQGGFPIGLNVRLPCPLEGIRVPVEGLGEVWQALASNLHLPCIAAFPDCCHVQLEHVPIGLNRRVYI